MGGPRPSDRSYQRLGVAAIVATGLIFVWRSLADLPLGTIDNPGPGAMPLTLAALLVVFAVWSLKEQTSSLFDASATDVSEEAPDEPGGLRHAILVLAAVVVAALAIGPLGYRLTMLALLLFFLGLIERKPVITVLLVSFGLSFGSYALLDQLLKVKLPTGPFGI
jgi:putative tricarboxylic transport membrane protein